METGINNIMDTKNTKETKTLPLDHILVLQRKRNEEKVRVIRKKQSKKQKYALYNFLSKSEKNVVDCIGPEDIIELLDHKEYLLVARILGVLIDAKDKGLKLNEDQETVLKMPWVLYEQTKKQNIW